MDDFRQDSQTGLPKEYFALCSEHFEASCFSRSVLIGTPVDFKRFKKRSVPSIDAKRKDSLDTDYPRNKGSLVNRFFLRNGLCTFLWDSTEKRQYQKCPSPHPQKIDFFSNLVGLFEICFRSSKMTDPRPCPTEWAYLEIYVQRRHAKLKPTTNYQLQNQYFLRVRETSQDKTPPLQTSVGRFVKKKLICLASVPK